MEQITCKLSGKNFSPDAVVKGKYLHPQLLEALRKEHPDLSGDDYVAYQSAMAYVDRTLARLEKTIMDQPIQNGIPNPDVVDEDLTLGERMADKIADFGGSWTFILSFLSFLIAWIALNVLLFRNKGFDPYPFILLNLLLSCLAALQAPIIMMSQNRQEDRDRDRARQDYLVNLKAEEEIRSLHQKVNWLIEQRNDGDNQPEKP